MEIPEESKICPTCNVNEGGAPPPTYLVWAILLTIFCCLPFGIPAIVYASQVNSKWAAGNFDGARESSRKAKFWFLLGLCIGLIINLTILILQFTVGLFAYNSAGSVG
ncbi:CD225/dispanin family protein [Lentisphaerota bacterium]|nr:CD225/dispanin family protein [Lentisphaerota bacterium]